MSKQIRMCIACKKRMHQSSLLRLQNTNGTVVYYTGEGRSFYLCHECSKRNIQELIKSFRRVLRVKADEKSLFQNIKEIVVNG